MDNPKKMEEMVRFVEEKAQESFGGFGNDTNIQLIQELLKKESEGDLEDFTFTIGEINAYMG